MNKIDPASLFFSITKLSLLAIVFLFAGSNALAQQLPAGSVACGKEGEMCRFSGTKEVWYGVDQRWKRMTATLGIKCDYVTFGGDPAPNVHKQCYFLVPAPTTAALPDGFTPCASEGELCTFQGVREVWYGAPSKWLIKLSSNGTTCDTVAFGNDPYPGTAKKCYTKEPPKVAQPTPVPVGFPSLSGTWKEYDLQCKEFPGTVTITQIGNDVSILNSDGRTALGVREFGRVLMASGKNGNISNDQLQIMWTKPAVNTFLIRQPAMPSPGVKDLSGVWVEQNLNGAPSGRFEIKHMSDNICIYQYDGAYSERGVMEGNKITFQQYSSQGSLKTATVLPNGKLQWNNNLTWVRENATLSAEDHEKADYKCENMMASDGANPIGTSGFKRFGLVEVGKLCVNTRSPMRTVECFIRNRDLYADNLALLEACKSSAVNPTLDGDPSVNAPRALSPRETALLASGEIPLSNADGEKVMEYIAKGAVAARLPYCWKQSYSRETSVAKPQCPSNLEEVGGYCVQRCKAGYSGNTSTCYANCPSGFADIGLYCQKPGPYGRGGGHAWILGDPVFDYSKAKGRCEKENPQGCESDTTGSIWYPKCKAGFHAVGTNICSPDCPSGWTDSGTGCAKITYPRAGRSSLSCQNGFEQQGLFCYPACKAGFVGETAFCRQQCPAQQSVNCGLGCATTLAACATTTKDQILSPTLLIAGLVTGGIGDAVRESSGAFRKLQNVYLPIKTSLDKLSAAAKIYTLTDAATKLKVDAYERVIADNFSDYASEKVEAEIDKKYGRIGAYNLKRMYAKRHLALMLEADSIAQAKDVIQAISVLDPIGVVSVFNAFFHPICSDSAVLPKTKPLWTY